MTTEDPRPARRSGDLATVHPLPARPTADAEVVDAEIVDDDEYQRLTSHKGQATLRWSGYRTDVAAAVHTVRTVATHHRTRTAGRAVLRHGAYLFAGAKVVAQRAWEGKTNSRYERLMRAAEAAGEHERLAEWEQRAEAARDRRHRRHMDWLDAPGKLFKALLIGLATLVVLPLALGIVLAVAQRDVADIIAPLTSLIALIRWCVWAFTLAWGPLLLAAPWLIAVALWQIGRTKGSTPAWVHAPTDTGTDVMDQVPDENTILNALRNLNIPGFTRAVKQGWRIRFVLPPVLDGKGWRAQLALPPACPVAEIVKRKQMLAHNLVRFPIEVWPTEPQPSVLDLWVAQPGALSGPVEAWPLLADLDHAGADYFAGVPAAVTIKGDLVRGRLFEANYAVGGMMGSGKSTLVITLLLGAMLDPLVDIDIVVMAENADYEPMRPRLASLTTGATEETEQTCLNLLLALYTELEVRGQALREHDKRAVSRALAEADDRLRPRVLVVDECQALFMGEHGAKALELAAKLISAARKYAITVMFLTPEPSNDALPRKLTSLCSNKACFAIGDQIGNDAVLGTGSYKTGISAVGLVPKTDEGPGDIGTFMARGFTAKPGLLRSHYVPQGDVHRVVARALQLRAQHGITGPADRPALDPAREFLADLHTVMQGQPRTRTELARHRLAELHPPTYDAWSAIDLATALREAGIPIRKSNGNKLITAADLAAARTLAAGPDDESTDTDPDDAADEFTDGPDVDGE